MSEQLQNGDVSGNNLPVPEDPDPSDNTGFPKPVSPPLELPELGVDLGLSPATSDDDCDGAVYFWPVKKKRKGSPTPGTSSESGGVTADTIPCQIPKCLQMRTVTKGLISYAESKEYRGYREAAHACIWARQEGSSNFGWLRAAVMMHLRFDGSFGFPGGLIEEGEDVVEGLNREMSEEIGWSASSHPVTWANYHSTQVVNSKQLVLHFFIIELSLEQYIALERKCPLASEYGNEVLGTVRVPLYTMNNMYSGLPAFLNNKFIGTAKQQLLLTMYHTKIMSEAEIADAIYKSQNLKLAPDRM